MTYEEAIKYIHGVSNFFCKPGLERIEELCLGLGNPQEKLKFIHVAGTNGKGSFCAMTDSVLRSAGYKVGLYTSPFLLRFNERMRVNGDNISNAALARLTEKVKGVADKMADSPTEFELITAIAFEYFLEEKCDVVILEVGMGGRLDATNIIPPPLLSVITGIAIDHTAFLGDSIEKIAFEKAGIIKNNSPVLYGGDDAAAEAVISQKAVEMQSRLYKTDYSELNIKKFDLSGTDFFYREKEYRISLLGAYQPKNACIVIDAVGILNKSGFIISDEALRRGLAEAKWPARFEIIGEEPTVIFDGAHNPQGINAAVESIKLYYNNKNVVIISGVLRDKDFNRIAESLSSVASAVFTTTPNNPRALSAEEYAAVIKGFGTESFACEGIEKALELGKKAAKEQCTALFCLGSLYTYADVIREIKK